MCPVYTHPSPRGRGVGIDWDNAVMERFFLNLKMERVWQSDYANQLEASKDIRD